MLCKRTRPVLVGIMLMGTSAMAQAQGLTVTRVTTPQSMPAGLSGLAGLAKQFGADIPTEIRETIYLNANGTIKRVDRVDEATIYNLPGEYLIEIDKRNNTWEQKTFEEFRAQFKQLGGLLGRGGAGRGQANQAPPTAAPQMEMSLNLSVDPQGETQALNGFADAELFHQFVEVETSGQPGQGTPGMSGKFVSAMRVWAVDRSQFDLRALNEFDRQLAEKLLGVPLGGSQDMASSMLSSPQAQAMMAKYESQMGALRDKEAVSTLTELYMLPQGQKFDPSQAFRAPADQPEPEPAGGGGGLFGGLGAALGGLGRAGGGNPPNAPPAGAAAGGGQTSMGSTLVDYIDYLPGAPDASLFEAPGPPFKKQ